jgi:peptidoglycan/xylan/chitin deacetylase (PgdA/CDA1 family)
MANDRFTLRNPAKELLLKVLAFPGVTKGLARLTNTQIGIFMLHRFSVPDLGISGHKAAALRRNLAYLRKNRYQLLPVGEIFERLSRGEVLNRTVAFTIDDGYFDHAEIAAPLFAEFDCPVTCFVATGFLDRKVWFWWDRLTYIFETTRRSDLTARLSGSEFKYRWDNQDSCKQACMNLNLRCQDASEEDRLACIEDLSRQSDVQLPAHAPSRFAPMTWDQARNLETRGVSFGPHTVTHPVLGTTSGNQSEWEITESWARLKAEVRHPVPVFCYPNGRSRDVGEREISAVGRLGLSGGLMAHPGDLDQIAYRMSNVVRYRAPRFSYEDPLADLLQCLSGVEGLKARLRQRRGDSNAPRNDAIQVSTECLD